MSIRGKNNFAFSHVRQGSLPAFLQEPVSYNPLPKLNREDTKFTKMELNLRALRVLAVHPAFVAAPEWRPVIRVHPRLRRISRILAHPPRIPARFPAQIAINIREAQTPRAL